MKDIFTFIIICSSLTISAQSFTLKSNKLGGQADHSQVFSGMGCQGDNQSPHLYWESPPMGTKSFAITMFDEDAPTGSGWWHWIVFDIDPTISMLSTDAGNVQKKLIPTGAIQSITDFGSYGYGGPCPPEGHGIHKYIITIFALKTDKLGLDRNTNPAAVGFNLENQVIEKASLVFYHQR